MFIRGILFQDKKIKSHNCEIKVTDLNYFEVILQVTPTPNWKYDVYTRNTLQDIRQNHWTPKQVTVTYIYFEVKLLTS